jgi:hypothetical protein
MLRCNQWFLPVVVLLFAIFLLYSCRKNDKIDTDPGLSLSFSTDTVFFDTVFTTVGSVTQRLIVYNPNDQKVLVSSITLNGGQSSFYRMNVSGIAASVVSDIEIPGKDSIFVFIRLTVDPNSLNSPFVVTDSIAFMTNGNRQQVNLVAWGQNADFYRNASLEGNIVWDSLKAHVIYGFLRMDTGSTLTILPGTKVYFHMHAFLALSKEASLKVAGTLDHPVRMQGDRLDPYYKDLPGQWDGIYLEKGSRDHEFNHAYIKNGTVGIALDSVYSQAVPMLQIDNSVITNMTWAGIYAYASSILSTNCVIGNCGGALIDITYGGNYDFRQLTAANYWSASVRTSPSIYLSNFTYDSLGNKQTHDLTRAWFGNTVIYGTDTEEIILDAAPGSAFEYFFDHCLLRTSADISDAAHYSASFANEDPKFINPGLADFRPDSLSPVIDKGIQMGVTTDIRGMERGATPDLGAYEYVPETRRR